MSLDCSQPWDLKAMSSHFPIIRHTVELKKESLRMGLSSLEGSLESPHSPESLAIGFSFFSFFSFFFFTLRSSLELSAPRHRNYKRLSDSQAKSQRISKRQVWPFFITKGICLIEASSALLPQKSCDLFPRDACCVRNSLRPPTANHRRAILHSPLESLLPLYF